MASKAKTVVGIDIGTSNINVVVAEMRTDGGEGDTPTVNIVGAGQSPSRGLRKGVVINIEGTVQSLTTALTQAETMAGSEIKSVLASISGSHIRGFNSHGIVGIKNREVSAGDVEKVIEAARAVAIPLDREVLHVLPQEFIIDDQDGIKEPLGISGVRLEAKVHIITGSVASAQNVVKCANRCGLTVQDIMFASLGAARAVLSPEEMELGVGLLDIGGGTCDIVVYQGGAVRATAVVPVGGSHITNDIAAGLRTPLLAAEQIKCEYGCASKSVLPNDGNIEVPSTGGRPPRILSRQVLAEIIEPRVQELLMLAHKELLRSGCAELLTSGLVLTGGSAKLRGIAEVAEQIFNVPARVGTPVGLQGLSDIVAGSEYAVAAGLVLQGASQNLKGRAGLARGSQLGAVLRRVGNWFADHF